MRKLLTAGCFLAMLAAPAVAADAEALAGEGKSLIMKFGEALKAELTGAIKEKGVPGAIGECNEEAPAIAKEISVSSGWTVARSSHKLRNPNNAPDAFTAAALEDFVKRIEAGEKAEGLAKAAIIDEDGKKVFHLVKAIPTGELCLGCHGGAEVKPEVEAKIKELYPDDQARGFKVGDMRGVFTLTKVVE